MKDFVIKHCTLQDYNGFDSNIIIPEFIEKIDEFYTYYSSYKCVRNICIPASVKEITYGAFHNFINLQSFEVSAENKKYSSYDGVLFSKNRDYLVSYPNAKSEEYTVPEEVSIVSAMAFARCENLLKITMGDNVKDIWHDAFWLCKNLKSVKLSNNIKIIDHGTFAGCESLQQITLPDNVETIGDCAFENCRSLKYIIIPKSVAKIGENAFKGCDNVIFMTFTDSYAAEYAKENEIKCEIIE